MSLHNGEHLTEETNETDHTAEERLEPEVVVPGYIKDVLSHIKLLGISPVCLGDSRTLSLTRKLSTWLRNLENGSFHQLNVVRIRAVKVEQEKGFCSIEPLTNDDCGWNRFSPHVNCRKCNRNCVMKWEQDIRNSHQKVYALEGIACLALGYHRKPGSQTQRLTLVIFCLDTVGSHLASKNNVGVTDGASTVRDDQGSASGHSDLHSLGQTTKVSEAVIKPELMTILERVSKDSACLSHDDIQSIRTNCLDKLGRDMYSGLIEKIEAEKATKRTASAVLAFNFASESDFCLYEFDFDCVLNYI